MSGIEEMRIGIDGRAFQGFHGCQTGIGRYAYELCRELDRILPSALFFVYSAVPLEMPVLSARWILRLDKIPFAKYIKSVPWLKCRCGLLCREDDLDWFWGVATFLPHLPRGVRTAITVYDLNFKIVPDTMNVTHKWAFKMFFNRDVMNADVVLSISKGSSDRLYRLLGRAADAIVYPAVSANFKPQSESRVQQVLSLYNLERPYFLSVATREPRKNLEMLVRTFLNMKEQGLLGEHKLVLVGSRGWKDRRLAALLSRIDSVIPVGYIPDEHLAPLYTGATAFVFPSLYEGFGIPVLEARSCGTKVVTSDIPELREAGGRDAIYFTPNREGIRKGLLTVLSVVEKQMVHELSIPSFPSWEDGAKTLSMVLKGELLPACQ